MDNVMRRYAGGNFGWCTRARQALRVRHHRPHEARRRGDFHDHFEIGSSHRPV